MAAGINYTLFTEENPDASVYSQSEEIKAAMPSVVAAAEKLGYKLDRMAIAGGSAGGCLALIYAYRDADTSPLPVKMVFEAVGPGSFHVEDWGIFGLDQSPEAAAGLFSVMSGQALTPEDITSGAYVPYKIGKLQIQGFSEPITSKKIKQSYHITQKAARSRQRAAFLRGKLGRRQKFSKK